MLSDRGMSSSSAALAASMIGVTIMISRVIVGYLIDRIFAPKVAACAFGMSAVGLVVLALGGIDGAAYAAMILLGFSIGAEMDLMTFLASRYFGLRHFGEIYGILFGSLLIGTSIGPLVFGWSFESSGSYTSILWVAAVIVAVSAIITLALPAYSQLHAAEDENA